MIFLLFQQHWKEPVYRLHSTNFKTFGKQEESSFNFHYKSNGYHPLLAFDGLTGDLLKASFAQVQYIHI